MTSVTDPAVDDPRGVPEEHGPLRLPLSPVSGDRVRPWSVAATVVGAVAVIVASQWGYAAVLGVVAALALAVVLGWPAVGGTRTALATSVVLGIAAAAMLGATVRDDLRWLPAAVALGMVAAFFHQLLRPPPRAGLVLSLLAAVGGLVLLASGALLAVSAHDAGSGPVIVLAMLAAAVSVVGDLLAPVRVLRLFLGFIVLLAGMGVAALAASWTDELTTMGALGIGAATATVSWSLRRVLALQPAILGAPGQVAVGAGSVLLVGALVRLFAVLF
ncbi:MAG: hypothetical protein L0H79_09090 [Intrasporangium sp.]|uniref:hypothetical protein n=1 Tax=Intrasporangium sp. TaxID=1925024 RepID=UPI0026480551|nr:hypothetical protein [Intrasporangium sp.]MDN5795889.1 hypothetical protein [Intrasporangium sp.]